MTARMPAALATDVRSLDALKGSAARDPKAAARAAANQFEALFMQMVMKSMRDASPKSGLFDGAGSDLYQGMLDTQMTQSMTGRPGGLGEQIARQLMRNMAGGQTAGAGRAEDVQGPKGVSGLPQVSTEALARARFDPATGRVAGSSFPTEASADGEFPSGNQAAAAAFAAARKRAQSVHWHRDPASRMPVAGLQAPSATARSGATDSRGPTDAGGIPAQFVQRMWPAAQSAERATGVPAAFIVGQAALESGWGRKELTHADGRTAFNLFGIKAGGAWKGATVDSMTSEFIDGRMIKTVERFRAYGSYEEAFNDWARLMAGNPRYSGVLNAGGSVASFAANMQKAGYATDPNYGSKLAQVIQQTLSLRPTRT